LGLAEPLSAQLLRALVALLPTLAGLPSQTLLLPLPLLLLLKPLTALSSLPPTLVLLFHGGFSPAGDLGDATAPAAAAAAVESALAQLLTTLRNGLP
jgi:hypothetical protein